MVVDRLEAIGMRFLPTPLSPRLRRIVCDIRRSKAHIFMVGGEWLVYAPMAASDMAILKAGVFCKERND